MAEQELLPMRKAGKFDAAKSFRHSILVIYQNTSTKQQKFLCHLPELPCFSSCSLAKIRGIGRAREEIKMSAWECLIQTDLITSCLVAIYEQWSWFDHNGGRTMVSHQSWGLDQSCWRTFTIANQPHKGNSTIRFCLWLGNTFRIVLGEKHTTDIPRANCWCIARVKMNNTQVSS